MVPIPEKVWKLLKFLTCSFFVSPCIYKILHETNYKLCWNKRRFVLKDHNLLKRCTWLCTKLKQNVKKKNSYSSLTSIGIPAKSNDHVSVRHKQRPCFCLTDSSNLKNNSAISTNNPLSNVFGAFPFQEEGKSLSRIGLFMSVVKVQLTRYYRKQR